MSDAYIPPPQHAFDRNPGAPEECRMCGLAYDRHPHACVPRRLAVFGEILEFDCAICGDQADHPIHGKPDSGFDIPYDE